MRRTAAVASIAALLAVAWVPAPAHATPPPALCGTLLLDVVIVLDASGSMGGEIDQLRAGLAQLVADIQADFDARFGLIVFGFAPDGEAPHLTDGTHDPDLVIPLDSDASAMQARLNTLYADGVWEPWGDALWILNRETTWRPSAQRVGVLITDEPHDMGRRVPGPLTLTAGTDFDGPELYEEMHLAHTNGIRISTMDAGSGLTTTQLQAVASITGGRYVPYAHGTPGLVDAVRDLIVENAPRPYRASEAAGLLVHQNVPSNPAVSVAHAHLAQSTALPASDFRQETLVSHDAPPVAASWARVMESYAGAHGSASHSHAYAESNISRVSLAGGAVTARLVHVEARVTSDGVVATDGFILDLRILGVPVPVDPGPAQHDVPGVGTLWVLRSQARAAPHAAALIEALRLEVRTPSVRETIVVGLAAAGAGCEPAAPPLTAWRDDDAASGGDAPAGGMSVAVPAVVAGRVGADDAADGYRFATLGPGRALSVALKPSERVVVDLDPAPSVVPPNAPALAGYALQSVKEVSLTPLLVELVDPTGVVRETRESDLTLPVAFEFNPHVPGAWLARVRHDGPERVNYTLAIAEHPIPRVDGEGTISTGDAPPSCGAGLAIASGAHVGGLYGDDRADALRFAVDAGEAIVAAMKPSENADGARFGLRLYDPACALRAEAAWDASHPEGAPRAIAHLAADQAGEWTLVVSRQTEAVGNYHLLLDVAQPQPPLLAPDAGTGGDAGDAFATGILVGNGAHQGRVLVGDDVDCYRAEARAGDALVFAASPSPGLDLRLRLIAPGGASTASNFPPGAPELATFLQAPDTGSYLACVDRLAGGGQYAFAIAASGKP